MSGARGRNAATRVDPLGLTAREREVLELLAQRLSNRAIAAPLHRSERAVENNVARLVAKIGASNRQDAVLPSGQALKAGIVSAASDRHARPHASPGPNAMTVPAACQPASQGSLA
ncbi:MAG TPA: helix-turn-helix transcriptional regulator [Rubrivivax sp.]|nr:helix-turn-helix transcriptional regulator [Rubrivivax sp.]